MARNDSSRTRRNRLFIAVAAALAALAILGGGALAALGMLAAASTAIPSGGLLFAVERGEGSHAVAARLERAGVIRSALAFRLLAKLGSVDSSLKAGTYRILPGMGSRDILDAFAGGRQAMIRITVPEGYTLRQTAALVERSGVGSASDFSAAARDRALLSELGVPGSSAEGYLYPDTYYFPVSFGGAEALKAMIAAFKQRVAAIPEAAGLGAAELRDRIILASIVEREYKIDEEAPLIASVFSNRLRIRMALQSCATVVYVITDRQGKPHPDTIFDRDLKIEDPYNTYLKRGLPPGPICSPGDIALRAAFKPANSKYLYFRLVDAEAGKHHFSETLEEHIDARALFIKRVGT